MATPKNFMEAEVGLIPVSSTTFSVFNLALTAVVVTVVTVAVGDGTVHHSRHVHPAGRPGLDDRTAVGPLRPIGAGS